ncbi:MAG: hypothetical protein Q9216_006782 [Gyalolechia sp. 2 TL-2023]
MLHYGFSKRLTKITFLPQPSPHLTFISTSTVSPQSRVFANIHQHTRLSTMPKRKSSAALAQPSSLPGLPFQTSGIDNEPPQPKRRASARRASQPKASMNPDKNANVLDAPEAFRASPDADTKDERMDLDAVMDVDKEVKEKDDSVPSLVTNGDSDSPLSDMSDIESPIKAPAPPKQAPKKGGKAKSTPVPSNEKPAAPPKVKKEAPKESQFLDPEADGEEEADEEEIKEALSRPPPVNSDYLPLPWKGKLGYACLNTYLRFSNPPVFSSRTCRIASILENRHPLRDPNEPPHATKNRPDREQPADVRRGQEFVEQLCLANVRDIPKMLRWNDRYGIKFMRLSSEMFPFASHAEYGYKLAPFASSALAEAGKVAAELGHRLTTHPGQYTQLGSPRKPVIDNALRDLDYHAELLSLLKLPPQQDRDAVMILHLGGVFGDKEATLTRFRENYARLPEAVKDRLVLENDDVSWSVHDLLPLCEDLSIPLVLDYHHHNIIFDPARIREGTRDIMDLYPRILATWRRKDITPKMHYSEPTPAAITGRQRRKHSPRVATLPPVPAGVDLMIEAKDKEQAVFELMRTFKLPGFDLFNDIVPHVRKDENRRAVRQTPKKKKRQPPKKQKKGGVKKEAEDDDDEDDNGSEDPPEAEKETVIVPDEEIGMGGPDGRVYWPPGQEHWLRPVKRVVKAKEVKVTKVTKEPKVTKGPKMEKEPKSVKKEKEASKVEKGPKVEKMEKQPHKAVEKAKPKVAPEIPDAKEEDENEKEIEKEPPPPPTTKTTRTSKTKPLTPASATMKRKKTAEAEAAAEEKARLEGEKLAGEVEAEIGVDGDAVGVGVVGIDGDGGDGVGVGGVGIGGVGVGGDAGNGNGNGKGDGEVKKVVGKKGGGKGKGRK